MAKLKPMSRFRDDIREGDLVRVFFRKIVVVSQFCGIKNGKEMVGYVYCPYPIDHSPGKYSVRLNSSPNSPSGRSLGSSASFYYGGNRKNSNPNGVIGYEILRRKK